MVSGVPVNNCSTWNNTENLRLLPPLFSTDYSFATPSVVSRLTDTAVYTPDYQMHLGWSSPFVPDACVGRSPARENQTVENENRRPPSATINRNLEERLPTALPYPPSPVNLMCVPCFLQPVTVAFSNRTLFHIGTDRKVFYLS